MPESSPSIGTPPPAARPFQQAALAWALGGVSSGLLNLGWLHLLGTESARVRDGVEAFLFLREQASRGGIELLDIAGTGVSLPFALTSPREGTLFAALTVLWSTAAALPLGLATAAGMSLVARGLTPARRARVLAALPAGVLTASLVPVLRALLGAWLDGAGDLPLPDAALLLAVVSLPLVAGGLGLVARRFLHWGGGVATLLVTGAVLGLGFTPLGGGVSEAPPVSPQDRPHVLLVSIDSLRADHLGSYGYSRDTSPGLDGLARDGVRFETVVAPTSWTLPSHLTLLTGLDPLHHGVQDDTRRLRLDAVTLPEQLQHAGFATAGFVSGPFLDSRYGYAQGFDTYDDYTVVAKSHAASHSGATSPPLLARVDAWLTAWDEQGRADPFFVFLHLWDVHYDFTPPPPYDTLFDPDYTGSVTGVDFERGTQVHPDMDPRDLDHVIALYDGEIAYTDQQLGQLFERLQELGVWEDTLVVVTSDHGEEFFEHGAKGHQKTLYDESLLVPLIVHSPTQVPTGRVVTEQVRLADIAPTILDLVGLQPKDPGDRALGHSLTPTWGDNTSSQHRVAFPALPLFSDLAAVRTGDHKYLREDREGQVTEALYSLDVDPLEQVDRSVEQAQVLDGLSHQLRVWRASVGEATLSGGAHQDEDHLERLRALGYVE